MKLVMFTPVTEKSSIGNMACLVTRALLAQGHKVTVVRTEDEIFFDQPTHDFGTAIICWNDTEQVKTLTASADELVYQIGDACVFHRGCLEWLDKKPGIVCLHDFYLAHLFHDWLHTQRSSAEAILRSWYGDKAADRFFSHKDNETFIKETHDISPMVEWICAMAHGVMTHSSWGIERVLKACPGPVYIAPLPYDLHDIPSNTNDGRNYSNRDSFRILTIGHVNPNKRTSSVLHAIGKSSTLQKRVVYQLAGKIHPEMERQLSLLANDYQINLVISGTVDHTTLIQAIEQADVICCLRWPALEAASASAIEAMLHGKPTIVTDTGFYRELPDNCVQKIDPENETDELRSTLELLYQDVELRKTLGTQAQKWAKKTFTAENYAQKLIDLCVSSSRAKPVINAANYFVELLKGWDGSEEIINLENTLAPLQLFDSI